MMDSLLQCLAAADTPLQKDMVSIIPEIVDDASLSSVVSTLRELMEQDTTMTVPVLDALGNLNLDAEQIKPISNLVLATIGSTAVENLPIVIRFLLQVCEVLLKPVVRSKPIFFLACIQSTPKEGLTVMIKDLRGNLDLSSSNSTSDMRDKVRKSHVLRNL